MDNGHLIAKGLWSKVHLQPSESPAWAVIRKADEWKADLVVVGSHGRSAFGRLILGSVSQKVVTEASTFCTRRARSRLAQ